MASSTTLLRGELAVSAMLGALTGGGGTKERRRMKTAVAGGSSVCHIGLSPLFGHFETKLSLSADVEGTSAGKELRFAIGTLQSAGVLGATNAKVGSLGGKRDACFARSRLHPNNRAPPPPPPPPLTSAFCHTLRSRDRDRDGGGAATSISAAARAGSSTKRRPCDDFLESRCSACMRLGRRTVAMSTKRRAAKISGKMITVKTAAASVLPPIDLAGARLATRTPRLMGGHDMLSSASRQFGEGLMRNSTGRTPAAMAVQDKMMISSASGQFGEGLMCKSTGSISRSQKPTSGGTEAVVVTRVGGLPFTSTWSLQPAVRRCAQCRVSSSNTRDRAGRSSEDEEEEEDANDDEEEEDANDEEEEEEEVIVGRREAYVDDADFDLDFGDDVLGERDELDSYTDARREVGEEEGGAIGAESSMTLRGLLEEALVKPIYVAGNSDVVVTGISVDSRTTNPGDVFVCIVGNKTDGHLHVSEAMEKGAVAVVASKEEEEVVLAAEKGKALVMVDDTSKVISSLSSAVYRHPSRKMAVIGVTGTNGKTTTTYLLRGMYNAMGLETGLIGTINHFVGKKKIESSQTTPESSSLHRLMKEMVDGGVSACVMEASSHGLELGRVDDVDFDVAVFTNFTRDHMDFHETEENYRNAKGKLFDRMVDPDRHRKVVNLDDPNADWFIGRGNPDVPVVTFGMEREDADVRAVEVQLSLFETEVVVRTPKGDIEISSGLLGRHNVYNILATVAVGIAIDAPLEDVVKGIEEVDAVPGRCELIDEEQAFAVVVDYAHTPDALGRLLDSVRECGPRRLITVIGCGGDRDRGKRPLMAKIATEKSEVTILTSDNPRTENPLDIIDDMLAGVGWSIEDYLKWGRDGFYPPLPNGNRLYVHDMRIIAVRAAVAMGEEGDAVVIAGKGHETYQIVGTERDYFDDREECREALQHVDAVHAAGIDTTEFPWRFIDQ